MAIDLDKPPEGTDTVDQTRSKKPPLSKESLESHGIYFDGRILPIDHDNEKDRILPPHVESLRRALFSFEASIHRHLKDDLRGECKAYLRKLKKADGSNRKTGPGRTKEIQEHYTILPPDNAYAPESTWSGELRTRVGNIDEHLQAARDAEDRMKRREKELAWTFYLLDNIFREYIRVIRDRTQYQYVRRPQFVLCKADTALFRDLFDQWRL